MATHNKNGKGATHVPRERNGRHYHGGPW